MVRVLGAGFVEHRVCGRLTGVTSGVGHVPCSLEEAVLLRARLEHARNLAQSKRPLARALRWFVAVLLGLEFFYVVAANLLLELGGVQALLSSTQAVKVDFARAWTVWPGTIHARKVKVVIADRNIQCLIGLERVVFNLRLRELPGRVFHATKLRGSGLSFRFRNRVEPEDAKRPYVSALPPVPGFTDPPLYEAWVPTPPITDERYNLWTVHIEDVDVSVEELWAQQFRYLGNARARGAFRLRPARSLWVGPATLDLSPGRVLAGKAAPFLAGFGGRIDCTVHPFDVRKPKGREVLRNVSTQIALDGRVAGTDVVRLFTEPAADVRVDQEGGRVAVRLGVDHGVVKPGSRIAVRGGALIVQKRRIRFDANAPWSITSADDAGSGGHVELTFAHATVSGRSSDAARPATAGETPAPLEVEKTTFTLRSTSRDLAGEWRLSGMALVLGHAAARELRVLSDVSPELPIRFERGSGDAAGRVADDGGVVSGDGRVELRDVVARVAGQELRGSSNARATVERFDAATGAYALDADVDATHVSVVDQGRREGCPWARAGEMKIAVQAARSADELPSARVEATAARLVAHWGDTTMSADAAVHAVTERTAEKRAVLRASLSAKALKLAGGDEERWKADADEAVVQTSLDWGEGPIAGPVHLSVRGVRAETVATRASFDATSDLELASVNRRTRSGEISGELRVRNADVTTGERHVEKWWASVNIDRTRVSFENGVDLDGALTTHLRDGVPLLFMLSERDRIPGWLPTLLPLNGLSGNLSVHVDCHIAQVDVRRLAGGPITATGRVSSLPDGVYGAILVEGRAAHVLSAGIGIGKKSGGLSLLAGEDWLKGHLESLRREARSISAAACQKPPEKSQCGR